MRTQKVFFPNNAGHNLAAKIEFPDKQIPHTFALFAHCFTCNKNLTAVRNIAKALTKEGFAIMRFDFTGLGESEGAFENTNFSSNIGDLIAATNFLKENYQAPKLLIGHSLGGAAVVCAATQLPEVKAVATIGAPFDPSHVSHLFNHKISEIETEGIAEVNIGGQTFTVKQQFLEDINKSRLTRNLNELNKALLIMHSPQDNIVEIENAAQFYQYAQHPKSFISLDGADHLLTNKSDSIYVGNTIASWVQRYIEIPEPSFPPSTNDVTIHLNRADGFTTQIVTGKHQLIADEPISFGGNDFGPSPYDLVTAGLGTCTAMTLHLYAKRKKWDLESVTIDINHGKIHAEDCENCEDPSKKIDHFDKTIVLNGNLDDQQKQRLLEIADRCPVHKTLSQSSIIHSKLG